MGVDYLNKIKLGWRKGWSRARKKLSIKELFAAEPSGAHMIDVVPFTLSEFNEGEPYEVQVEFERLFVYRKGKTIGVCTTPSREILGKVEALGGKTLGAVRTKGSAEHIEVVVLVPSDANKGARTNEHVPRSATPIPQQ